MKTIIAKFIRLHITVSLFLLVLLSVHFSYAHFGSKGPFGGAVSCATIFDSTVYIGTSNGGVYISSNSRLVSWTPRPVGLKSGKITALAHSGKYLFAATADSGVFIFNGFEGSERYWIKKNNGLTNLKITSLVAIDSITLMAGTSAGTVFKTTDKGNSWTPVNTSLLLSSEIKGLIKVGNRIILIALNGGAYVTENLGGSWVSFNNVNTLNINGTTSISYNESSNEVLLFNSTGLYKASAASTTLIPDYIKSENGLPTGIIVRSISNNGGNWYLATNQGIYTSASSPISWSAINSGLKTNDVTTVIPFQTRIVAGTNGEGIYKANLPFSIWTVMNNNFNNLVTYSMASSGALVVAAATEKGVFVSKDLAASYVSSNKGLTDSLSVNDITFANTFLLAATKNSGVFLSTDSGATWSTANKGLINMDIKKIYSFNNKKYAVCSNGNVYTSSLQSTDWNLITSGLPVGVNVSALAFSGTKIFLSTLGSGVYIKDEIDNEWSEAKTGLTNLNVTSLAILGSKVFAGTQGSGVFVSDVQSVNWAPTSNTVIPHTVLMGLNGNNIQALSSYAGYVFASYKGGLLASSDNGATWIGGGNQFNLPSYSNINKISFVTTRVFVTTETNGLYSGALSELPVVSGLLDDLAGNTDSDLKVSPNPNNGQFKLQSIVSISDISIFNSSGKLVYQSAGSKTEFDVDFPRGMYFIKAKTEKGIVSQKFVLE